MKKYFLILLFLILALYQKNYAIKQVIEYPDTIFFDDTFVGEQKTYTITIKNNSNKYGFMVRTFFNYQNYEGFKIKQISSSVNPNSSEDIAIITFSPKTNITYVSNIFVRYYLILDSEILTSMSFPIVFIGKGKYKNPYYDSTDNLWGEELFNELKKIISNHKSYSYKEARKHIWTGPDRIDGMVECFYTGRKKAVSDDPDFTQIDQEGFNTEHIWPRAYGADDEPELSDMFHICPTFKTANTKRDNYPFDYVTSNISYQDGGSKLGKNSKGDIVFEVRDSYKGNIARSMFYFALRYGNKKNYLDLQENTLREWHLKDPPDEREKYRNDFIYEKQNNRNPFIDYPELIDRMPSLSSNGGKLNINSKIRSINVTDIIFNDPTIFDNNIDIYFYNDGNQELTSTITLDGDSNNFLLNEEKTNLIVKPYSYQRINFNYVKSNKKFDKLTYILKYSNGQSHTNYIEVNNPITNIYEKTNNNIEIKNNPSDNNQIITYLDNNIFTIPSFSIVDITGRQIDIFKDKIDFFDNKYSLDLNKFKINLNNGTYILKIKDGNNIFVEKIIIIK